MRQEYPLWLRAVSLVALVAGISYWIWREEFSSALGLQLRHLDAGAFLALIVFTAWMLGQLRRFVK